MAVQTTVQKKREQNNQNFTPAPKVLSKEETAVATQQGHDIVQQREKTAARQGITSEQAAAQNLAARPEEIARKQIEQANLVEKMNAQDTLDLFKAREQLSPGLANQVGTLTPEQQNRQIVQSEGLVGDLTTAAGGVTGAVAGAGVGAGIGTLVAPGVGTAVGAAIGGTAGFFGGAYKKISISKKQDVATAKSTLIQSKSNMAFIINEVNAGRLDPIQAADMWDEELANFYASERTIHQLTRTSLDRFLSDGQQELKNVEGFRRRLPQLNANFQQALLRPNANASPLNLNDSTDNTNNG